jgi:hypothetical protein
MPAGLCLMLITLWVMGSCQKDRVVQDDFQSMDSFYNTHKEEEQVFVIDTLGSCPLIARKETKICIGTDMIEYTNGSGVIYPFILKVVELYSIRDMILWRLPAIAGGNILETSAEIRVRAFKANDELVLKPGKAYFMEMDTMPVLLQNMQAYYGYDSGNITDWTSNISSISPGFVDTISNVGVNAFFYSLKIARMGWISSARLNSSAASKTPVTFSVAGTNTQNIEIYLSFKGFKGLMKVSNLTSGLIPVGEQVTMVAFAKNQKGDFLYDQQSLTITPGLTIPLNMKVTTETGLLNALNAL